MSKLEEFRTAAEKAYRKVYDNFALKARNFGYTVTPGLASSECFVANAVPANGNSPYVAVNGKLRIDDFPRTRKDAAKLRKPSLMVLMISHDRYYFRGKTISKEESRLTQSNVQLAYYHREQASKFKTLAAIRYDYSFRGATAAHPIFHAQLENGQQEANDPLFHGLTIDPIETKFKLDFIRIPTANMIGPLVFLKLAADHLGQQAFEETLLDFRGNSFFTGRAFKLDTLDAGKPDMCASTWYSTVKQPARVVIA